MPVPASLCMQDVQRGEGAPWGVGGHREGHSQAWPALRIQGRGLIATFLFRFQAGWGLRGGAKQVQTSQDSDCTPRGGPGGTALPK
jgi:hypothetical protein